MHKIEHNRDSATCSTKTEEAFQLRATGMCLYKLQKQTLFEANSSACRTGQTNLTSVQMLFSYIPESHPSSPRPVKNAKKRRF